MRLNIQLFGGRGASSGNNSEASFIKSLVRDYDELPRGDLQGTIEAKYPNIMEADRILRQVDKLAEKETGRYKLQQAIYKNEANDNTRVIIQNAEGGNIANIKMTQINSEKYAFDLDRQASKVIYDKKNNQYTIKWKKTRQSVDIPF